MTADVTSANIVGYQEIAISNSIYQLVTVTFKDIGAKEKFDIQNIRVVDETGAEYIAAVNRVKIQFVDESLVAYGTYGTTYNWRKTATATGWHKTSTYLGNTNMVGNGQAMLVNNTSGKTLFFRISGEVELNPTSIYFAGGNAYQTLGNMTPVALDIQDIVPYSSVALGTNKIKLQLIDPDKAAYGTYGTTYNWRSTTAGTGWHKTGTYLGRGAVIVQPGQGFLVQNGLTEPAYLQFKSPVTSAE